MSPLAVPRRERRVLIIGGTVIGGLIAVAQGVPAWDRWQRQAFAAATEMQAELLRAEKSVQRLPETLDSLEARTERFVALAPAFIGVETPASAAGSLASLVAGVARNAGVEVGALRVRHDSVGPTPVARVSVRADMVADIRGLAALLVALEQDRPRLAVRELSVSQPEPAAPASEPERLSVHLRVDAIVLDPRAAAVD